MDIRVLQYFLTIAREENITKAAEVLHMTQPPLSRQIKDLEDELGKKLFNRESRRITLTEEGIILRKRAEEIIELFEKAKSEVGALNESVTGEVYIGGGETKGFRIISKTAERIRKQYPKIRYHLFSGNADDVTQRIDKGLLDFGILIEPSDIKKYNFIRLPSTNKWGLLMKKDNPLSEKKYIVPEDLHKIPLIASRQSLAHNELTGWLGREYNTLNIVATYNLLYNASLMVEENIGCALCLDGIIPEYSDSPLCFRPLEPKIEVGLNIVWKMRQMFSKPAKIFLEYLQKELNVN